MIVALCLLFVLIAGAAEGIMDSLQFHFERSIFSIFKNRLFWDPKISWRNKWKDGDPDLGERFRFSSTLFVGLTDAWHLFKTVRNLLLFISIPIGSYQFDQIGWLIGFALITRLVYGLGFKLTYR